MTATAWHDKPTEAGIYVLVNNRLFVREIVDITNVLWWRVDDGDFYYGPIPFSAADIERSCTCHPDDKPPIPCAKKFALGECKDKTTAIPPDPQQEQA